MGNPVGSAKPWLECDRTEKCRNAATRESYHRFGLVRVRNGGLQCLAGGDAVNFSQFNPLPATNDVVGLGDQDNTVPSVHRRRKVGVALKQWHKNERNR